MSISLDRRNVLVELSRLVHGEDAARIVKLLLEEGEMTDEQIAKALDMQINHVRRTLHRLFDSDLVRYRRTRDEKIGWYIYFWRVTDEPPEMVIEQRLRRVIAKLTELLENEQGTGFFICPRCGEKQNYDQAIVNMFQCPKCGEMLEEYDNSETVEFLEGIISRLKRIRLSS